MSNFYIDQDWQPVVLRKKRTPKPASASGGDASKKTSKTGKEAELNQARQQGAEVIVEKKYNAGMNRRKATDLNSRKIEDETENFHIERVDFKISLAIQKARTAKNMTQADLARAINEAARVVNDYEAGRAIPSSVIITKMEKALGTRLRPEKKKPATVPTTTTTKPTTTKPTPAAAKTANRNAPARSR